MPASKRVRPKVASPWSGRVARYVNQHFEGNLSSASTALGCNYQALWKAANGFTVHPSVQVASALASHSGEPLEKWLTAT